MEAHYDNKIIETLFNNFNLMKRDHGQELTKKIKKRYSQLMAADTFYDFLGLTLGKPHSLTGNRAGCYGIWVTANIRLIVKPIATDLSAETLKTCTKFIIKGVEDYHGGKTTSYIP